MNKEFYEALKAQYELTKSVVLLINYEDYINKFSSLRETWNETMNKTESLLDTHFIDYVQLICSELKDKYQFQLITQKLRDELSQELFFRLEPCKLDLKIICDETNNTYDIIDENKIMFRFCYDFGFNGKYKYFDYIL